MKFKYALGAAIAVFLLIIAVPAGASVFGQPGWFHDQEKTTDKIAAAAQKAVPYPLATVQAGGFLERRNLATRLERLSKANKIGYVYLMSFGKFVGYYVIKGKVSSVNSSMTNTNQTWDCGDSCTTVVESMGDDGTFGPNEGGDNGVFFITSNGTMVETSIDWVYSDQPLNVDVPNLLKR